MLPCIARWWSYLVLQCSTKRSIHRMAKWNLFSYMNLNRVTMHSYNSRSTFNTHILNSWIENLNAYSYTIYIHSPNCFWHIMLMLKCWNAMWSGAIVVYFVWCMRKISISSTTISSPLETMAIMKFIQTLLKNLIYYVCLYAEQKQRIQKKIESSKNEL